MPLDEGFGRDRALGRQLLQVDPRRLRSRPGLHATALPESRRNRSPRSPPSGRSRTRPVQRIEAHEERAGPERPVAEPVRRVSLEMRRHGAGLAAGERLGDAGPFEEQGRLSDGPHDMHGEDLTRPSRVPCARQLSERGRRRRLALRRVSGGDARRRIARRHSGRSGARINRRTRRRSPGLSHEVIVGPRHERHADAGTVGVAVLRHRLGLLVDPARDFALVLRRARDRGRHAQMFGRHFRLGGRSDPDRRHVGFSDAQKRAVRRGEDICPVSLGGFLCERYSAPPLSETR